MKYVLSLVLVFVMTLVVFGVPKAYAYGECSDFGLMVTYDMFTSSCKCMSGYVMGKDFLGKTSCVSGDGVCRDKYGSFSRYSSSNGSCECSYGYILGVNSMGHVQCISHDTDCSNRFGYNARYNILKDSCECQSGYVSTGGSCVEGNSFCRSKHGIYSNLNSLNSSCECNNGYTLNAQSQCAKKENNVYFILVELATNDRQAIILSSYDNKSYLISYGIGCLASSFQRYLHQQIVVNLGTDYDVDTWDKVVLQNDDETCDITRVEVADSNTTLLPPTQNVVPPNIEPVVFNPQTPTPTVLQIEPDPKVVAITKGRLLLQVEDGGRIWYVSPVNGERYEVTFTNALSLFQKLAMGISDTNLNKIAESKETRTGDRVLATRLKGRLLLQVEDGGRIWYVNPLTLKRHEVTWANLMDLFRSLSLGVSDENLNKLQIGVVN